MPIEREVRIGGIRMPKLSKVVGIGYSFKTTDRDLSDRQVIHESEFVVLSRDKIQQRTFRYTKYNIPSGFGLKPGKYHLTTEGDWESGEINIKSPEKRFVGGLVTQTLVWKPSK